jgi:hypothetical protein
MRIAATLICRTIRLRASLEDLHLLAAAFNAHTLSAKREAGNRINEFGGPAPSRNRLGDRGVQEEASPTECATHDANVSKRRWRRARPERATDLRADAFGGRSFDRDSNPTCGTTNIHSTTHVHQPSANHRRLSIVRP